MAKSTGEAHEDQITRLKQHIVTLEDTCARYKGRLRGMDGLQQEVAELRRQVVSLTERVNQEETIMPVPETEMSAYLYTHRRMVGVMPSFGLSDDARLCQSIWTSAAVAAGKIAATMPRIDPDDEGLHHVLDPFLRDPSTGMLMLRGGEGRDMLVAIAEYQSSLINELG